jgi:hypothetical protein
VVKRPHGVARRASVSDVPLILQKQFYCGPAALAMVLQWSGKDVTQEAVAAQSFTPSARGTFKSDMTSAARRQGMLAIETNAFSEMLEEVDAGHPLIVFQNVGLSWAPAWHYGVLVGYDLDEDTVVLHSGERDRWTMPIGAFLGTWEAGERWALLVLPPDRLPVSLSEIETLRAAAALERIGKLAEAAVAYQAGASRWSSNWLWPFGLGNVRYAAGDINGAEAAFLEALVREPSAMAARSNLDTLRAEQHT